MADGTITFSTALDNSQLETDLKAAEKEVDALKKKLDKAESDKTAIEAEMERNEAAIHETEEAVRSLRDRLEELAGKGPTNSAEEYHAIRDEAERVNAEIAEATAKLEDQIAAQDKLNDKWQSLDGKAQGYSEQMGVAKARAAELGAELKRGADKSAPAWSRAAASIREKMAGTAASAKASFSNAANQAAGPWETLGKKIKGAFKKAFVFSMIVKGVKAIKAEMSSMMAGSDKFTAGIENLKAVMRGFLSSVVSAVLPALTAFVNTLAGIFERVAGLVDSIFGTNISGAIQSQRDAASAAIQQSNAQKSAEYQGKQAKAAKKLAKEQEKANAQLMGFDEINALSAESTEDATDAMDDYAAAVEAPELTGDWTQAGFGDLGIFQQVVDWLDMIRGRIETDVEGPFARIREGLDRIKLGWGELVQGVTTGDWGLAWQGVRDIVIGACYGIEGAFGAMMDWLDGATGGRFSDVFGGLKGIVHGAVMFVEACFTGDLPAAFDGLIVIAEGVAQTLNGIVDGIFGFVLDGVNDLFDWLEGTFPFLSGIIEPARQLFLAAIGSVQEFLNTTIGGAKQVVAGALTFIEGLLTGNIDLIVQGISGMASGIKTIVEGAAGLIQGIVDGVFAFASGLVTSFFGFLREKFPELTPLLNWLEGAINGVLAFIHGGVNGVLGFVLGAASGIVTGVGGILGGLATVIYGILTGSMDQIGQGLRGIANGFIAVIEGLMNGAIGGVVDFANGIIEGLSMLPGISIPSITFYGVGLPRLATGAVIPPNREFLAVLGDQSSGMNVEAPESLIRQIVAEETGRQLMAAMQMMRPGQGEGDVTLVLQVGNEELARATAKGQASLARRGQLNAELVFA